MRPPLPRIVSTARRCCHARFEYQPIHRASAVKAIAAVRRLMASQRRFGVGVVKVVIACPTHYWASQQWPSFTQDLGKCYDDPHAAAVPSNHQLGDSARSTKCCTEL